MPKKPPILQTQPQPQPTPAQEIPEYKPVERVVTPESPQQPITQEQVNDLEKEMNDIKKNWQEYYAKLSQQQEKIQKEEQRIKQQSQYENEKYLAEQSAGAAVQNARHLLENLKGRIFSYIPNEAAKAAVLEAFGPLGQAFRALEAGEAKLHPSYKNILLNPDAVYYYLKSLPEHGAFKLMMLPFRAGLQILAYGGGPFTKVFRTTEPEWDDRLQGFQNKVVTKTIFTPLFNFATAGGKAATFLDKLSGWDTVTSFTEDRQRLYHAHEIDERLKLLHEAKKDFLSSRIAGDEYSRKRAKLNLKQTKKELNKQFGDILLDHDGFFRIFKDQHGNLQWSLSDVSWKERLKYSNELIGGVFRATFKKALTKTARNLRRTERDPLTYLAFLIGNLIWDLTAGLAANIVKTATMRVLSNIPGFNLLRAQIQAFFGTEKFITFGRMGLTNITHALQGGFSLETASSGYLGYKFGSLFTPNLYFNLFGVPFNVGGALATPFFAAGGAFYKTALLHATTGPFVTTPTGIISLPGLGPVPQIVQWTNQCHYGINPQYRSFFGIQRPVYIPTNPISGQTLLDPRFSNFTEEQMTKWLAENGYKYFEGWKGAPGPMARFGAWLSNNPYFRLPIKGFAFGNIFAPILERFGIPSWVTIPVSTLADYLWQIKGTLGSDITYTISRSPIGRWFNININYPIQNFFNNLVYQPGKIMIGTPRLFRPWANSLVKYLGNFFNPGFFAGFSLIHPFIMAGMNPLLATFFGPIAGASGFLLYARGLAALAGKSLNFIPQINAWSWLGTTIGFALDLIIPGSQWWLVPLGTWGLPAVLTLLPGVTAWLGGLLSGILAVGQWLIYSIGVFGFGLSGVAVAQGLAAFATAASIATVAGLVIFTGFVIYSAFWVPMLAEWRAQPTSTNFSIQTDYSQTGPNQYRLCADFDITQDVLSLDNYLELKMDFEDSQLTVNMADPPQTTSASRNGTRLNYFFDCSTLSSFKYCVATLPPEGEPPFVGGFQTFPVLQTYLSAPSDVHDTLPNLIDQDQSVAKTVVPFLQLLQEMAKDKLNPEGYIAYFVQGQEQLKNLLNSQKNVLDKLQQKVHAAAEAESTATALEILNQAVEYLNTQSGDNPVKNPDEISCTTTNRRCLEYKDTITGLYTSWPGFVNQQLNKINDLVASVNNSQILTESAANFEANFTTTEKQWLAQKQLVDKLDEIKNKIYKTDAEFLTDPNLNINNFTNLTDDQKIKLWEILRNYFGEIFTSSKYSYIPQGTNYRFCADTVYCFNNPANCTPARPQTVCSSISYRQNLWLHTAFAKSCTTFTPQ